MFSNSERRALFLCCADHAVAMCCGKPLKPVDMAADLIPITARKAGAP